MVRKMLRSLPKKFDMKVTCIEEFRELDTIKLDDLVGSLQTFEMSANERAGNSGNKSKSIAFVSNANNEDFQGDFDTDERISDAIVLLGRQFNKVLKQMDKRPESDVPNILFDISKQANNNRRTRTNDKAGQSKGVQCHECEGYGHIMTECATYLKRQKKRLGATWSEEEEYEEEVENELAKHVTALTGVCESDSDSNDDDVSYDELAGSFKALCIRSEEVCEQLEAERRVIIQLKTERNCHLAKIGALNDEVSQLNSQLEHLKKQVVMMHHSTHALDEILEKQVIGKPQPIGFDYETLNKRQMYDPDTKFMTPEGNHYSTVPRQMFQHPKRHQNTQTNRSRSWICHHCGKKGHIRPFCYKLYGYPKHFREFTPEPPILKTRSEWKPKGESVALIAHTSFRASSREDWYFDSGCSRHMTGISRFLENVESYATSFVTFGDGAKGEIMGTGKLVNHELPKLDNVLLVKGLTANLISISQLCVQGMKVNLTQSECLVTDEEGDVLMRGVK
jgi:hypothetical protein